MKKLKLISIILFLSSSFSHATTPTITSFRPSSGPVGTLVTIVGTNLQRVTAFTIGSINAIVVSDTSIVSGNYGDTLVGLVMPNATTGTIFVNTIGGTVTSGENFTVTPTRYPSIQQGNKLVATGEAGMAYQGQSVAVSADGNTAIAGGNGDSSGMGAVWVYTRNSGIWTQQGHKLVGTGIIKGSNQGISVALSADGNTFIEGGDDDNSGIGAAWVFTRSQGIWTQQGSKLVGVGAAGPTIEEGYSVGLSADGNTAIVGGYYDSSGTGAAWVFTRSAGVWTQQGNKLVGTGAVGGAYQGYSVAISADGNTAIVGGVNDGSDGAAWIFTRSAGIWTQQGNKLVGTGEVGGGAQGYSVALSADGNTALVGGTGDNYSAGATWVYTRNAGIWTQQGNKLIGTWTVGKSGQGDAVSLSADGNTAIVGGESNDGGKGASWTFTRSAGIWTEAGSTLVGTGITYAEPLQGNSVAMSADGNTAIVGGLSDGDNIGSVWVFAVDTLTTAINELNGGTEAVKVYPNPTTGIFNIQLSGINGQASVAVYNSLGQQVYVTPLNLPQGGDFKMNLGNQPCGIYLYRITSEKGELVGSGKLVKE